ncbi:anti-repressor SinI family protein [Bacillus sp. PAMC26568]|nr:anti-repressor SinI family protein [Bacillus sp. PAMC26568]
MKHLDQEWLQLISQAKELGITIEDVKEFLNNHPKK